MKKLMVATSTLQILMCSSAFLTQHAKLPRKYPFCDIVPEDIHEADRYKNARGIRKAKDNYETRWQHVQKTKKTF
uniref:Uncharacterized protein n=1 Tax=Caenorhabditis japonica TaxID=281687 RepID=A0A8R1IEX3_CAEJA